MPIVPLPVGRLITTSVGSGAPSGGGVRNDVQKLGPAASQSQTDMCRKLWLVVEDATDLETYRCRAKVTDVCAENVKFVTRTATVTEEGAGVEHVPLGCVRTTNVPDVAV